MRPAVPVTRDYTKIQIEPTESVIQIKIRPWDVADREYWSTYGINRRTLELYNVFPCEIVFYNKYLLHLFKLLKNKIICKEHRFLVK